MDGPKVANELMNVTESKEQVDPKNMNCPGDVSYPSGVPSTKTKLS